MEERLQKIIARAGVASRRTAEALIAAGRVTVNGTVVTAAGSKADPERDEIMVDGRRIVPEMVKVYLALNKPVGYVTTRRDEAGRKTVLDLLGGVGENVFPVGRLDYDSEGLLLLTNDGQFAQRITHPRYGIAKTYRVKASGRLTGRELRHLTEGVPIADGIFRATSARLEKLNPASSWVTLTVAEGRNRVIRRAFAALGHPVELSLIHI